MDLDYLKELLSIFDESTATEISLEEEGAKIKISKKEGKVTAVAQPATQVSIPSAQSQAEISVSNSLNTDNTTHSNSGLYEIKSPIVGTFYSAPSPDSPEFVKVGDRVEVGQTLCIVEAMKLMNEIESDTAGTIEKIVLSNADPVEYDEVLFLIKKD